ncbi:MAG: hypothetical protein J6K82_00075 [Alphaproteobacteria bacterium]|nr:hypothetical protein [Alphaproteobacteria bacterium]
MNRFYFVLAGVTAIFFTYCVGVDDGYEKCLRENLSDTALQQMQIIKIKEKVNEDVVNTGVGDIRRVLHEKYTIHE